MSEKLIELRDLLCQPPSERTWRHLLTLLELWPDNDEREMALTYADAHLDLWPDELRMLSSTQNQTPCWRIARYLHLTRKLLNDEKLVQLSQNPLLAHMKSLAMGYNEFGAEGIHALTQSPHIGALEMLLLHHNALTDTGAEALALSPHLGNLHTLHLRHTGIGNKGAEALANAVSLQQLTQLDLDDNSIEEQGAVALLTSEQLTALKSLNLESNHIGDAAIEALVKQPHPTLQRLYLNGNPLSQQARHLLQTHHRFEHMEIYFM